MRLKVAINEVEAIEAIPTSAIVRIETKQDAYTIVTEVHKAKTKNMALVRKQREGISNQKNLSAIAFVKVNPSQDTVFKNDMKLVEKYISDLFKFTFGSLSLYSKEYKECVKIAQAEYLHDLGTLEAEKFLKKEGLDGYVGKSPKFPFFPMQTEKKILEKNLVLIEQFFKDHYIFMKGKGSENSTHCKKETLDAKIHFLTRQNSSEARRLLSQML